MARYVVQYGAGRARRYLARAEPADDGRRPFAWTADGARAETFASAADACTFALDGLGHALWDVGRAPRMTR